MSAPADLRQTQRAHNRQLGWVLAAVAFAFFVGIVVKRWLFQ